MIDLRNEWWLAKKVFGGDLVTIFYGVTDVNITRTRMREAIIERGLADQPVAKGVSYREAYRRLYGVSL